MKMIKENVVLALILFGISFFCGFIVFAVGLGSFFPQMNQVARPFVCGDQSMEVKQYVNHYRPGETSWTVEAFCVTEAGNKVERTGWVQFTAGLIYSILPFVILVVLAVRAKLARDKQEEEYNQRRLAARPARPVRFPSDPQPESEPVNGAMEEKLEKLKSLRAADLISAEDYQRKKDEILKEL
jgi:ABC-type multidrug transport system fused ATPase/permease subunit